MSCCFSPNSYQVTFTISLLLTYFPRITAAMFLLWLCKSLIGNPVIYKANHHHSGQWMCSRLSALALKKFSMSRRLYQLLQMHRRTHPIGMHHCLFSNNCVQVRMKLQRFVHVAQFTLPSKAPSVLHAALGQQSM